ncbi:hypothetical protein PTRG_07289 [Pyrenophora tritici-repentis Pt-1C-BFP]|uniref:Uncharacterized protein n=1 Tax=Pyrenophora tritici-repentis (strain Pt-1C-BFP) TaxID=426418 RepID=B2WAH6_PYRTR|nr:uncharacterized protein PTRG_07289 [Pyrenophora tritici-repentis Pt-1C-BFP]EDU50208.1 hypothetical protein PTRG_07289 [Pyrenophora tritici-repentis Pt-1C-BFP]
MPNFISDFEASEIIAIVLLMGRSRKATEDQILGRARNLPYFHRCLETGSDFERQTISHLILCISRQLKSDKSKFNANFPHEQHFELRVEPSLGAQRTDNSLLPAWKAKAGAEMAEEEGENEDYEKFFDPEHHDNTDDLEKHYDERKSVHVLPPGTENAILARHYKVDFFSRLPLEIKEKIFRLVLVFPGKLQINSEVLQDEYDDWTSGTTQRTITFNWGYARDGTKRYGERPLEFINKLNIDLYSINYSHWQFDRVINTPITIPHLTKLVIHVKALDPWRWTGVPGAPDHELQLFSNIHDACLPIWRKLPWAASKVKIYTPGYRKIQKWLQNLINMPDNEQAKIYSATHADWKTDRFSSDLIVNGVRKAECRWKKAVLEANTFKDKEGQNLNDIKETNEVEIEDNM